MTSPTVSPTDIAAMLGPAAGGPPPMAGPPQPLGAPPPGPDLGPMQAMLAPGGAVPGGPPPGGPPMGNPVPNGGGLPMLGGPGGPMGAPEQKKPPLLLPPRLATQLARGYVDQARQYAGLMADHAGPPDDFGRFTFKQQVQAWYKRDLRQDPLALKEQGLSDTEIRDKVYPLRRVLLKMVGPSPTDRVRFVKRVAAERARIDRLPAGDSV